MTLVGQSVLRGPDGTRWVVSTLREGAGFVTTARRTGCDLTPAGTTRSETSAEAERAHRRYCEEIKQRGAI
ncbi:MAG TPA: hypothetical protein VGL23_02890 [Chloroflexota bacterium]